MAKIEKFEDIVAWQKARQLVNAVYKITEIEKFKKDFGLKDQTRRAAISIMLNISEGFARRTNKEFVNFLFIAHGSVAEVQSATYIALDLDFISESTFKDIYGRCEEISKMLSGLIKYLRQSQL